MRTRPRHSWWPLFFAALAFGSGCRQTTTFTTEPSGGHVYVNGLTVGSSPATYVSRSGLPRTYYLKIEKAGYKTIRLALSRQYAADSSLLLLLPGIVPYFLTARLPDKYHFRLTPTKSSLEESRAESR